MALVPDDFTEIWFKHESQWKSLINYISYVAERVLVPFSDTAHPLYSKLEQAALHFREAQGCLRSYKVEIKTIAQKTLQDIRSQRGAAVFITQAIQLCELQRKFETVQESFNKVLDVLVDVKACAAHGKKDSTVAAVCSAGLTLGPISILNNGTILTYGGPVIGGIASGFYIADQLPTDNKFLKFLCGMAVGAVTTYLCLQMPGLSIALRALPCVAGASATALSLKQRSEFTEIIEQIREVQLKIDDYKISLLRVCQLTADAARRLDKASEPKRITRRKVESIEKAMESLLML